MFSELELVFCDTTSIDFEGEGGEELGQYGHSKDHRPDRKQMVVGMVLDNKGRPICCELWPSNVTDVRTLVPIVDWLKKRFHIGSICIVADHRYIVCHNEEQAAKDRHDREALVAKLEEQLKQGPKSLVGTWNGVGCWTISTNCKS